MGSVASERRMALPALGESNIQFREVWKIYARASPAGDVIEIPGLTIPMFVPR